MASVFLELIKMAVAIKSIPNSLNSDFKKQCIGIFNRRWAQFDTNIYLLAFFLHPKYRGKIILIFFYLFLNFLLIFIYNYLDKGFTDDTFREVCLNVMKIWKNYANGGENSCRILLSQL
jgi:hypothetical protein